jgi:hypothetical protein
MIQETGGWIKNADTKTTVLAAAFGVSLTIAVARIAEATPMVIQLPSMIGAIVWFCSLTLLGVAVVAVGWNLYRTLLPHIESAGANRFAWPDLAAGRVPNAVPAADGALADAWLQVATLSGIANQKYRRLRVALKCFGIYLILLTWIVALAVGLLGTA